MGGAGYNPSLSVGRAARSKASTRTPVHFWLDVPLYKIDLPCGHAFLSRTPLDHGQLAIAFEPLYCARCRDYKMVNVMTTPVVQPRPTDELTNLEQDKGVLRERAAIWLARNAAKAWTPEGEAALMEEAMVLFGLTQTDARRIFVGVVQSESGPSASLAMCRAGLHPLTPDNVDIVGKYRTCKECRRIKQRERRERVKAA